MVPGAIIRTISTAEQHPAALADTPQQNTEIIAIPSAHGASIVIRSTAVQKPAHPAAHLLMIMQITAIPMARGCRTAKRDISAPRRARPAAILAMNTLTTPTRTVTASATIAVQLSA